MSVSVKAVCICKDIHMYLGYKQEDKGSFQYFLCIFLYITISQLSSWLLSQEDLVAVFLSSYSDSGGQPSTLKVCNGITSAKSFCHPRGHLQFPEFKMWSASCKAK